MTDKRPKRIVIFCSPETHERWRRNYVSSGTRNYEEFALKLLELYEKLKEKYEVEKIDLVLDRLSHGYVKATFI